MKPYFTKYLPVEGKIKEDDYKINSAGTVSQLYCGKAAETDRKVKLFLCIKNVKVGDKNVYGDTLDGLSFTGYMATIGKNGNGSVMLPNNQKNDELVITESLYKVIGEISPDALGYVKEGDEFDEDQISCSKVERRITCDKHNYPYSEALYLPNNNPCTLLIKGPCNHFH